MRSLLSSLVIRWAAVSHSAVYTFCWADGCVYIVVGQESFGRYIGLRSTTEFNLRFSFCFWSISMNKSMSSSFCAFGVLTAVMLFLEGVLPHLSFQVYFLLDAFEHIDAYMHQCLPHVRRKRSWNSCGVCPLIEGRTQCNVWFLLLKTSLGVHSSFCKCSSTSHTYNKLFF